MFHHFLKQFKMGENHEISYLSHSVNILRTFETTPQIIVHLPQREKRSTYFLYSL